MAQHTKVALIFGISGQDGGYLAHLLLSKGYQVHGTSRDPYLVPFANLARLGIRDRVTLHAAALGEFRSVVGLLSKVRPDEVYNLAGQSSVALSFDQPIETFDSVTVATINIMECIRYLKLPTRLFNATSSECFGPTSAPADERAAFRPTSPYGMAKAASFWATATYREAYGLFACSGILSNHESPLRPERFVARKIVRTAVAIAREGAGVLKLGNVDVWRDWGLAADYVQAMWLMLQQDAPNDYVVATGTTMSLRDFIGHVFGRLGLDARGHVEADAALLRPLDLAISRLDPSRAATDLGWRATFAGEALAGALVGAELNGGVGPLPWSA